MCALRIDQFGGVVPRTSERLLPANVAQQATNCNLSSGDLVPLRNKKQEYVSAKIGPLLSIYRAFEDGYYTWMAWPDDVDVVLSTLSGKSKFCFTGDGEPRITNIASATSGLGHDYPHTAFTLGTPAPVTAPSVAPSGGSSATVVERYYGYSFYSLWDGVELEGAISPLSSLTTGKIDDTWAITGMDASPTSSGTVTGVFASGYTTFTDANKTWLRAGEQVVLGSATVDVTETPSATTFKVLGDYSAVTAWARKAAFAGTLYKRIYRTAGTSAQFQMVADQRDGGAAWVSATAYNDSLTDGQIPGDELISSGWDMPPVDLKGIVMLPSGALLGISGKYACLSEPDQPHAWPAAYRLRANHNLVAVGSFGSGAVAATESTPYIINGVEPGQQTMTAWDEVLPCLSKRSMVSLGDAAVYSSPSGLVSVNSGGASIFSLAYFTDEEWRQRAPATMVCAMSNRRLHVMYTIDGTSRTMVFNLLGDTPHLTEGNFAASEIYADSVTGKLYFSDSNIIYEYDPDTGYSMMQDWMSSEIVMPARGNVGAAKITFDVAMDQAEVDAILAYIASIVASNAAIMAGGNARGAWSSSGYNRIRYAGSALRTPPEVPVTNTVTFILYADGVQVTSVTVANNNVFRLPAGYTAERVTVRVQSQCRVRAIELGKTPRDLGRT